LISTIVLGWASTMVLVCGVLASLALGVLVAYWICLGMFGLFKIHARQIAAARTIARNATPSRLGAIGS
jgi:hypothetical protein